MKTTNFVRLEADAGKKIVNASQTLVADSVTCTPEEVNNFSEVTEEEAKAISVANNIWKTLRARSVSLPAGFFDQFESLTGK